MQCAEFESRLNDLLDQRRWLDADPRLAEHVRRCGECRHLAAAYEAVVAGLEQSRVPEPGPALTGRVLADFAADSKPLPQRSRPARGAPSPGRYAMVAALAATILLAAALRWTLRPAATNPAESEQAAAPQEKQADAGRQKLAAAPRAAENGPAHKRPAKGGDLYRGLAAETSQSFAVAMQLFPGVDGGSEAGAEQAANDSASDWMHGLSDGLKPVTRPTAGAVNSFFHLLAAGGDEGSRS
jgi:hypothetical protein